MRHANTKLKPNVNTDANPNRMATVPAPAVAARPAAPRANTARRSTAVAL